jgi:hypothetical protein
VNKFVQTRNARKTVSFQTPMVAKRPPLLTIHDLLPYQLSHKLDHLADLFSAGTPVAE